MIRLLNQPLAEVTAPVRRKRKGTYTLRALRVVESIRVAAGYPWSVRLKALLPLWLPCVRAHWPGVTPEVEAQVLSISPRQIDRHLAVKRRAAKKRLYGRTKPGKLLRRQIAFTRTRPNKKDDNAHIKQKNWAHVRKVFGWEHFDTQSQRHDMNDLYRQELRIMMNLFQPSVKLLEKQQIGSSVTRRYDAPQTPLDPLVAFIGIDALPPPRPALGPPPAAGPL